MDSFLKDLRYGFRMLRKSPGSTLIAMLALTLAIGANSAIFSVVNGVLLRELRYRDADRLAVIWESQPSKGKLREFVAPPNFKDWVEQQRSFDELAAFRGEQSTLTGSGTPEHIETAVVSAGIFHLLGVKMQLGRPFAADEDRPGRNHVAILSYGLWRRRFGGDRDVTRRTLTLDGKDYQVVGVTDTAFHLFDTRSELWIPYVLDASELTETGGARGTRSAARTLEVVGRLKPGVTIEQARGDMKAIAAGLERQYPDINAQWTTNVVPLREQVIGDIRPTLFTLLGAVGFVLLIACSNVANLLLARASGRQKEIAVRTAMGAGQLRIVRQLLTESIMLSLASGVLGLLLAYLGVEALVVLGAGRIPRMEEISVDGRVLAFTLLISVLTGVLFGIGPALTSTRSRLNDILKAAGRSSMASLRSRRLRSALVVSEIGLSVVLLIGAVLMIRSFFLMEKVNPGFRPDHVLSMRLTLPDTRYQGMRLAQFYSRLLDKAGTMPGIESAGITRDLPLSGTDISLNFIIKNRPVEASALQPRAKYRAVSSGYFAAMGIPIVKGRFFSASDTEHAPAVAIVNEALVRKYFADEDPINQQIQSGAAGSPWCRIVGVVTDIRHAGLDAEANPEMYFPYLQVPPAAMGIVEGTMTLVARTATEPTSMARALAEQVRSIDPEEAVFDVTTMDDLVQSSVARPRFRAFLLGVFAAVALILAATGLYGVISYSVSQRSNELGIRTALGAQKGDLFRMILGEGAMLAMIGIFVGLVLSFALAHLVARLLFGVKTYDPLTFILIPVLLLAVALFACYVPARRATRTDPSVALRCE